MPNKNIIGLKKGIVKLKKHNPNWKKLFEKEKEILLKKFPKVIIEISHGGSTAIPDILAKPVIDMFAIVKSLKNVESIKDDLEKLGYEFYGQDEVTERILYTKGKSDIRTHHLHFVEKKSKEWKNHILIREYFLKYPEKAKEYAELKVALAKKYPKDRKAYTNGKDAFIKTIIKKSKEEK